MTNIKTAYIVLEDLHRWEQVFGKLANEGFIENLGINYNQMVENCKQIFFELKGMRSAKMLKHVGGCDEYKLHNIHCYNLFINNEVFLFRVLKRNQ